MKKIKIKCRLFDSISNGQYYITILDLYNNIIFQEYTNDMGWLFFDVPYYGVYKINILKDGVPMTCTTMFVKEDSCDTFNFILSRRLIKEHHLVTFQITDGVYTGLPIKEGKLILCQSNM